MVPIIYHKTNVQWQKTKVHHSVSAQSENSGLACERRGFAGRTGAWGL
ncbi:hypothetical protein [Pedobacter hartonius]|nr:hypothetical protein [Pedobacter hartonius]